MSLQPQKVETIPAETVRVAKAAFPKGNFCLKLRDEFRCNALSKKVTIKGAKNRQGAKLSKSQSLTEPLNQISVA